MPPLKDASDPGVAYDFDIHDPGLADRVYDTYTEMRERCPVARSPLYGGHWVVTKYQPMRDILRDPAVFSSQ
jgi:cytochrome P450